MNQLSIMRVVAIEVAPTDELAEDSYVRHILVRDEKGYEFELVVFADREDDLKIRNTDERRD